MEVPESIWGSSRGFRVVPENLKGVLRGFRNDPNVFQGSQWHFMGTSGPQKHFRGSQGIPVGVRDASECLRGCIKAFPF